VTDFSMSQSSLQSRIKSRSMGVKLILVCGLAMLMIIPALFVGGLVEDRTQRAADVIKEIGSHVGGQQTFSDRPWPSPTAFHLDLQQILRSTACTWCFPHELRLLSRSRPKNGAVLSSRFRCSRQI